MKDKKYVWFSVFKNVVPAEYENWLEEMAAQGWHLHKAGQWSSVLMVFVKGEPQKLRFVYDLQVNPSKTYQQTYTDFGWEFVGQMASVFIWKMPYEGERPEAFTDAASVNERVKNVVSAISVSFILMLVGILAMFVPQVFFPETLDLSSKIQLWIAQGLFLVFAGALGLVMIHIKRKSQ